MIAQGGALFKLPALDVSSLWRYHRLVSNGFLDKLLEAARRNRSLLCIGLDPDPALMPIADCFQFNRAIVDATSDLVCAYKPNLAFYEALGMEGLKALERTIAHIGGAVPVIGDAKRGDIGSTARRYAQALFDTWGFDAVTVNPYLGYDSLEPFLERAERGVFILCRTSNAGSADFQALALKDTGRPLFEVVAQRAQEWDRHGNVGLVVGAPYPQELGRVRQLCPAMPILIPGVGAQGGEVAAAVRYGVDANGERAIISASRGVLYASGGGDFAAAARERAQALRDEIERFRAAGAEGD